MSNTEEKARLAALKREDDAWRRAEGQQHSPRFLERVRAFSKRTEPARRMSVDMNQFKREPRHD